MNIKHIINLISSEHFWLCLKTFMYFDQVVVKYSTKSPRPLSSILGDLRERSDGDLSLSLLLSDRGEESREFHPGRLRQFLLTVSWVLRHTETRLLGDIAWLRLQLYKRLNWVVHYIYYTIYLGIENRGGLFPHLKWDPFWNLLDRL